MIPQKKIALSWIINARLLANGARVSHQLDGFYEHQNIKIENNSQKYDILSVFLCCLPDGLPC